MAKEMLDLVVGVSPDPVGVCSANGFFIIMVVGLPDSEMRQLSFIHDLGVGRSKLDRFGNDFRHGLSRDCSPLRDGRIGVLSDTDYTALATDIRLGRSAYQNELIFQGVSPPFARSCLRSRRRAILAAKGGEINGRLSHCCNMQEWSLH